MPALNTPLLAHGTGQTALAEVALVFVAGVWILGALRLRIERPGLRRLVGPWRITAGLTGLVILALALCPPIDNAADGALSVHMCQHLAIGMIAPLLICLSRPMLVLSSALDRETRRNIDRRIAAPRRRWSLRRRPVLWALIAVSVHVSVWWFWHFPPIFNVAVHHNLVHACEHALLFAAGMLLWWVCLGVRWDDRGLIAVLVLFTAAVGTGMIGALITIAPHPVYATTLAGVQRFGLSRLSDQQLGGVIMWILGGAVYLVAGAVIAVRWLWSGPARGESIFDAAPNVS